MRVTFPVAILLYLLLLLLINGGLFVNYYLSIKEELHRESVKLLHTLDERLLVSLEEVGSDLNYLASLSAKATDDASLAEQYFRFLSHKTRYDQLRFLDAGGMERARVNYNVGIPYIVSLDALQDKSSRYYFSDAIALQPGDIYISPLDLNMEHNQIEVPLKPMIRFVAVVPDGKGGKAGVVVLNYLAAQMLEKFRTIAQHFPGQVLLLNKAGYYLVGFDRASEWGFMFPDKEERTFEQFDPGAWKALRHDRNGHYEDRYGTFDFATLDLTRYIHDEEERLTCRACHWSMVSILPESVILQRSIVRFRSSLLLNLLLLSIGVVGLWFIFVNVERRRMQEREIEALNQAVAAERELFIEGPTVIMEFRNEYGWPVTFASENVFAVFGYQSRQFAPDRLNLASIIAPEFLETFAAGIEAALKSQQHHFEHEAFQVVASDARRIWVQDEISLLRDAEGKVYGFLGYFNDISALKSAEKKVQEAAAFVQTVVDSIADPTLVIDVQSYEVLLSNKAAREFYLSNEAPEHITCYQMSHSRRTPCDGADDICPLKQIFDTKKPVRVTHRHYAKDGSVIYVELLATPIFDDAGHVVQIIESHRDISRHVELEAELKQRAATDKLTGAYNRAKFDEELSRQLESALRYGISLGIIMFDIDHFKNVNDTYGHNTGDEVLIGMARLFKKRIRRHDILARWGGEEFAILIPQTDADAIKTMAEGLRQAVESHRFEGVGSVTASFGATLICDGDTPTSLMKRVDRALYRSKETGRNRTTVLLCDDDAGPDKEGQSSE